MSSLLDFINNHSVQEQKFENLKVILEKKLNVRVKDYNNLYSIHITKNSCLSKEAVRDCTGIVLEKDTNKVVHFSFSKSYDSIGNNNKSNNEICIDDIDFRNVKCELYNEGTLIKVFWDSNKWNTGTSNTIYAYKSFWGGNKSFYEMFVEGVKKTYPYITTIAQFYGVLNKEKCYTFLLQHPNSVKILEVNEPRIIEINSVCLKTLEEERPTSSFYTIKSVFSLNENISNNYILYEYYPGDSSRIKRRIKKLNLKYLDLIKLRGNHPNIDLRYIELIKKSKDHELKNNFPQLVPRLKEIDRKIYKTIDSLHYIYLQIKVRHLPCDIPENLKRTIVQLHGIYRKTKQKITKDVILQHLISLPPRVLLFVLDLN